MKDYMPRSIFIDKTVDATKTEFSLRLTESEATETPSNAKFCHSTRLLTMHELEEAAAAPALASSSEGSLAESFS
jgi:hypothetical protein